ncbi:MAG: hypothetical protein HQK87_05020, partial [Nitrospinae bacterium]|nr:hypothetical protein [Nitrospinota bacterium]
IIFAWIFGVEKGFAEIHSGADIRVPVFYKYVIKYVTPTYLIGLLIAWFWQDASKFVPRPSSPHFIYEVGTIVGLVAFIGLLVGLVELAGRRGAFDKEERER